MFEIEPILWLQSVHSHVLNALMFGVSAVGHTGPYSLILLVLAFGLRLRPTLGLVFAMVLVGTVTTAAKMSFELPRPSDVDARVMKNGEPPNAMVAHGAATTFWSLPSDRAIQAKRASGDRDYGFISGHVSAATAFVTAFALLFAVRSRAWLAVLFLWPVITAISRMYLGRHFPADVLGGFVAGALVAGGGALWFRYLQGGGRRAWIASVVGGLLIALVALGTSLVKVDDAGHLLGVLATTAVLLRTGFPRDAEGSWKARLGRTGVAAAVFLVVSFGLRELSTALGWHGIEWVKLALTAIGETVAILGSVAALQRLGLYGAQT